ncbi:MAG: PAS domain-containing protein [Synechococcaceae cyanobacterium SM2_3_1]|nr:PAS domain-containing protein [Synechococcaceae cyanobacterium SM2_3_1]
MVVSSHSLMALEDFTTLLKLLLQAQTTLELVQSLAISLEDHLPLQTNWIAYPGMLSATGEQCYWVWSRQAGLNPSDIHLSQIPSETLIEVSQAQDYLLPLPNQLSPWVPLADQAANPATLQERSASPQHQAPEGQEYIHFLSACYPQGEPPWLVGFSTSATFIWTSETLSVVRTFMDLAAIALQRQTLQQQLSQTEQQQRSASNRLMDRLRVATEATRQVVYEWTIASGQRDWAPALRAQFGHLGSLEQESQIWWSQQIHPDDRERVLTQLQNCLSDLQVFLCEYRWQRADGFFAWVRDYGRLYCGSQGQPVRMIGSLEDISTRRRTAAALTQFRQGFELLLHHTQEAWVLLNSHEHVIKASPGFIGLLGYDLATLTQMGSIAALINPADINQDCVDKQRLLESQIQVYTTEKRFYPAEGSEMPLEISVYCLGNTLDCQFLWHLHSSTPSL